jgi:tetratricopeptide (TPR) repeat protein
VTGTSSEFSVDTFGKPRKLTLDPNHILLSYDRSTEIAAAIRRGEQFVEINDFPAALREFQKALEVNKTSSLAHYRIGELFFRQNNYQSAANEPFARMTIRAERWKKRLSIRPSPMSRRMPTWGNKPIAISGGRTQPAPFTDEDSRSKS